jgi:hypothetical protein
MQYVHHDYELAEKIIATLAPQLCGTDRASAIRTLELAVGQHARDAVARDRRDQPAGDAAGDQK